MTELHLALIIVYNARGAALEVTPSGRVTTQQVQAQSKPGTYCHYERGVTIYLPELSVDCPQVFLDRGRVVVKK